MHIFTLISIAFQIWMMIDFFNRKPGWYWFFVILLSPIGTMIYYFIIYQSGYSPAGSSGAGGDFFTQRRMLKEQIAKVHYNPTAYNYNALGDIYFSLRKYADALENYEISLTKEPNSIECFYKKGLCLRKLGRINEAIEQLEKVVNIDPSYSYGEAYMNLAENYMEAGKRNKALGSYREILQRHSFIKAHYNYGILLNESGQKEEAMEQMKEVVMAGESMPAFKMKTDKKYVHLAKIFLKTH